MWIPKSDLQKLGNILRVIENGEQISDEDLLFVKKWADKGHKICNIQYNSYISKNFVK